MSGFEAELHERLRAVREQELYRELRRVDSPQSACIAVGGGTLLNFSSNDYLGLANHPALKEAAILAVEEFGAGAGASRLICGSLAPHHELEAALAEFERAEAALMFSSGYATALGVIGALVGKDDVIVLDKLVHASIVDAARLSGAKLRIFAHNDLEKLETILRWADTRNKAAAASANRPRTLVVTESVFSMDGDLAPLRDIARLKDRYGAWLMVDEAHATGLFGARRNGLVEEFELADQVEVRMGTLGKAVGAAGGYVCGSRALVDYLVNRARSFIFSTAPAPAAAAAAAAGIKLIQSAEGERLRTRLWVLVNQLKDGLIQAGWPLTVIRSAILPLMVGGEKEAMEIAVALRKRSFFVPAIRYPTVARGQARLRVTVTAAHSPEDIVAFTSALAETVNRKS